MIGTEWRFRMISSVILVILVLQVFAIAFHTGSKGWPFIDYPMYSPSLEEGDRLDTDHRLYATVADSSEILIRPESIGLSEDSWWIFRLWILTSLDPRHEKARAKSDSWLRQLIIGEQGLAPSLSLSSRKSADAATSWVVDLYRQRHGKDIIVLRLEDEGVIITRDGIKTAPTMVLWEKAVSGSISGDS
jgi:hypothetical protein